MTTVNAKKVLLKDSNGNPIVPVVDVSGSDTLPSQTGNAGKYLTTNGTAASWAAVVGGAKLVNTLDLFDVSGSAISYEAWTQPVLSDYGTMGGDSFAVETPVIYGGYYGWYAFDSNSNTEWETNNNVDCPLIIYNPVPLKVSKFTFTSGPYNGSTPQSCSLQVSNDGTDYTTIDTFTTSANMELDVNVGEGYKYWKFTNLAWMQYIYNVAITAQQQVEVTGAVIQFNASQDTPLSVTFSDDTTSEFTSINTLDLSSYTDGEYVVFIQKNGTAFVPTTYTVSDTQPSSAVANDVWYDTDNEEYNLYSGGAWDTVGLAQLGVVNVESGGITDVLEYVSITTEATMETVTRYTDKSWAAQETIANTNLPLVPYTMTNVDFTSFETVTASTSTKFNKSGIFVSNTSALSTLAITDDLGGTSTVYASWYPIYKETTFTSSLAGKFYYFVGQ